jgi:hypothetical protein
MSIYERAMLVDISISQWSMRRYDKKVTREIEEKHETQDAGNFNKILIAVEEHKKIIQASGEARTFHYTNTLPWSDEGKRILPSANYWEYVNELNIKKHKYWRIVQSFWNGYERFKEESRVRLNTMFDENDYPPLEVLRDKYKFDISFLPIPKSEDFRVDIGSDAVDKIRLEIEQTVQTAEREAIKDLWTRLYDSIKHIIDRLSSKDAIFHDTLIGNVVELSSLLPRLNFTNDPHLNNLCKEINQSICTIAPESIRKDANLRKATVNKADEIIKKVKGYMDDEEFSR